MPEGRIRDIRTQQNSKQPLQASSSPQPMEAVFFPLGNEERVHLGLGVGICCGRQFVHLSNGGPQKLFVLCFCTAVASVLFISLLYCGDEVRQ